MAAPNSLIRDLVHQGWDHLRLQRPLAAWSSWNQALRLDPADAAAREALEHLAASPEFPDVARAPQRLRPPLDEDSRQHWDRRFHEPGMDDLERATALFRELAAERPDDTAAWHNLALCLAWLGRNVEAVAALDEVVKRVAFESARRGEAVSAWMLAEVLRQGAGAESLADAVSCALEIAWPEEQDDFPEWLSGHAPLVSVGQVGPGGGVTLEVGRGAVYEWLDRPVPDLSDDAETFAAPRVRSTLHAGPGVVRLLSPSVADARAVESDLLEWLGDEFCPLDRASTPLPIAFMDLPALQYRLPPGLETPERDAFARDAVARYYEQLWSVQPRLGLTARDGSEPLSPIDAARGDDAARTRLEAIILVYEQMANRPNARALYGGYRFDALRRRLGLETLDPDGRV